MKETALVRQILDYCGYRDMLFWRNQSGMVKTERGHMMKMGAAGSPDLIGCLNGQLIGVECKVGKNKPTQLQLEFGARIERNGGQYWVVYSLDDFIYKLTANLPGK